MMNKVSLWIKQKLQSYVQNEKYAQSALSYGVDMALYTIISTVGLLVLSLLMNSFVSGTIIIATCYLNQTIGGGYHASTHMKCFLSMVLFLTIGVLFSKLSVPSYVMYPLGVLSVIILFLCPVVLHPNRAFQKSRLPYFSKRSRYVTALELLLVILFSIVRFCYSHAYIIALALSAISRLAAKHSTRTQSTSYETTKTE